MYNAKMSMRNLGNDLASSYFTNTINTASDVKNGYQEVVNSKKSSGFNGIKNRLKQTALFKFASDLTKNAFEGLRTGKFYKSDDDLFGFDESAFDFDLEIFSMTIVGMVPHNRLVLSLRNHIVEIWLHLVQLVNLQSL